MRKINSLIILMILITLILSCGGEDRTERIKELYWIMENVSEASSKEMSWGEAVDYCHDLGGRLPTISELRTFIQNCPATETYGSCGVTDSCLSYSECRNNECSGCFSDSSGKYSVFGDTGRFWSSSSYVDYPSYAWNVDFGNGYVSYYSKANGYYARCVR